MLVRSLLMVLVGIMLTACDVSQVLSLVEAIVALPSEPSTILGTITELDERILIEQQPGAEIGNKVYFDLTGATRIYRRRGDTLQPVTARQLEVGQRVEAWADGAVLESFPGQAAAAAIVILADDSETMPEQAVAALPDRAPDASGTVTQTSNTIWVDWEGSRDLVLFITPATQFFRRTEETLQAIDASAIAEGQQVDVWVDEIRYAPQPQANATTIVVAE